MAVQTRNMEAGTPVNKLLAVGVWGLGVATTYAVVGALLGTDIPWYIALIVALLTQAMLTAAEWRFFVQQRRNEIGIAALVLDVLANAGGLYQAMKRFGETPIGAMLSDVFGVPQTVSNVAALILALLIGYVLARAPEYIWQAD